MKYWIVASKHSRDSGTKGWDSKWTADSFLRKKEFYPNKAVRKFGTGDICVVRTFISKQLIGEFTISSDALTDSAGDQYFELSHANEWEFPVSTELLPIEHQKLFGRHPYNNISERIYNEIQGIKKVAHNLKMNFKHVLYLHVKERDMEDLIDTKNALEQLGLEITERQFEITPGNIIDLLCKDSKGDLVVVELKKHDANSTVGQLGRYVNDVRVHKASASQKVSGLILSMQVDEQLIKSCRGVGFDVALCQIVLK